MSRIRPHLTYANVMTSVLLFIVLGGSAYALEGRNSVRSDDIKNGEVRTGDLHRSAVTGSKIKDDSLDPGDIDSTIAQPHGSGDVPTAAVGVSVPYPLIGNSWTQPAGEVEIITGTVTYRTPPGECLQFGNPSAFGNGTFRLKFGNSSSGSAYLSPFPVDTVKTTQIVLFPTDSAGATPVTLFPPGTDTGRTLTAEAEDNCDDDNFTIQSVDTQIVGVG